MNHLETLTKNAELIPCEEKGKCKKCLLWSRWCESLRNRTCQAGEGKYFSKVKLWGSKKEFLKTIKKKDPYSLGEPVWDWIENLMINGNGMLYMRECIKMMREGLLSDESFSEYKETIQNFGPDNYQLKTDRSLQNEIKFIWWRLVKYQYNLRYNEDGKPKSRQRNIREVSTEGI